MIRVICPHCGISTKIENDMTIYNLNRIGDSTHECQLCRKRMRIFFFNEKIEVRKLGKKKKNNSSM